MRQIYLSRCSRRQTQTMKTKTLWIIKIQIIKKVSFESKFCRHGITRRLRRPWPTLPLVLALVPFNSFPKTFRFPNGSSLCKMRMALPFQRWNSSPGFDKPLFLKWGRIPIMTYNLKSAQSACILKRWVLRVILYFFVRVRKDSNK